MTKWRAVLSSKDPSTLDSTPSVETPPKNEEDGKQRNGIEEQAGASAPAEPVAETKVGVF